MITLLAHNLQWIKGVEDDPQDQCAHGRVEFRVNNTVFVKPEDGSWTVSAAGLYLLRTLSLDHNEQDSVTEGNLLFPCCGHAVWPTEGKFNVVCIGCNQGINVDITHDGKSVSFASPNGTESTSIEEWQIAVLEFVRQVRDFYDRSSPKVDYHDDLDRQGWTAFWQEWHERVDAATAD